MTQMKAQKLLKYPVGSCSCSKFKTHLTKGNKNRTTPVVLLWVSKQDIEKIPTCKKRPMLIPLTEKFVNLTQEAPFDLFYILPFHYGCFFFVGRKYVYRIIAETKIIAKKWQFRELYFFTCYKRSIICSQFDLQKWHQISQARRKIVIYRAIGSKYFFQISPISSFPMLLRRPAGLKRV